MLVGSRDAMSTIRDFPPSALDGVSTRGDERLAGCGHAISTSFATRPTCRDGTNISERLAKSSVGACARADETLAGCGVIVRMSRDDRPTDADGPGGNRRLAGFDDRVCARTAEALAAYADVLSMSHGGPSVTRDDMTIPALLATRSGASASVSLHLAVATA
jgi:hypothetical protein